LYKNAAGIIPGTIPGEASPGSAGGATPSAASDVISGSSSGGVIVGASPRGATRVMPSCTMQNLSRL